MQKKKKKSLTPWSKCTCTDITIHGIILLFTMCLKKIFFNLTKWVFLKKHIYVINVIITCWIHSLFLTFKSFLKFLKDLSKSNQWMFPKPFTFFYFLVLFIPHSSKCWMAHIYDIADIYSDSQNIQNENDFKKRFLPWMVWLSWEPACKPKGHQFDSQSGNMPALWASSPVGGWRPLRGNVSMFLYICVFLPFPVSKNK